MSTTPQTVVVLGASPKAERFSYKAIMSLKTHGHQVIPIHPLIPEIEGIPVISALDGVVEPVDTLTVYVGPQRSAELIPEIIALGPKRVILNPGTESPELEGALNAAGIAWLHDCTLVMLDEGRF
ncbi:CoA-binding protein [Thiorhodospira sibirica]|uniref:CoA-binding protein n=1 Tax=Thiorhodospira sibirica TaxID=154347 RepID=UPI00022C1166|nr:CoA-binding protein [Thiorhodospira sibirica]